MGKRNDLTFIKFKNKDNHKKNEKCCLYQKNYLVVGQMIGEHYICEKSELVGKTCEWVRKNIADLKILHIHHGISDELMRATPQDNYVIKSDDYIKVEGTPQATLKLIDLSTKKVADILTEKHSFSNNSEIIKNHLQYNKEFGK